MMGQRETKKDDDNVGLNNSSTKSATKKLLQEERRRKTGGTGLNDLFIGIFGIGFLLSATLNFLHETESIPHGHNTALQSAVQDFKGALPRANNNGNQNNRKKKLYAQPMARNNKDSSIQVVDEQSLQQDHQDHEVPPELFHGDVTLHTLNCDAFGGPPLEAAQEMVYWADIPSDAKYISPFYDSSVKKYMTFEPDGGGWNNIRMVT